MSYFFKNYRAVLEPVHVPICTIFVLLKKELIFSFLLFFFHFFPSESCGILPLLLLFREKKNVLHKGLGNMWLHGLYFF